MTVPKLGPKPTNASEATPSSFLKGLEQEDKGWQELRLDSKKDLLNSGECAGVCLGTGSLHRGS